MPLELAAMGDTDDGDAQILADSRRSAQRLTRHLAGHTSVETHRVSHAADPKTLKDALGALELLDNALHKESLHNDR